jgi:hypothetical protein
MTQSYQRPRAATETTSWLMGKWLFLGSALGETSH